MADGGFPSVLKWVGYATAVLSLIAGIRQLTKSTSDAMDARRKVESLLASERIQAQGKDYGSAWRSLEDASKIDSGSAAVREAQENLAMVWLENADAPEGRKFSDITEKLDPVLTRGLAGAKTDARRADLQAHLGWSYFLRSRDGTQGLDPAAAYTAAVQKDPNNPYAQAMWGHLILWETGNTEESGGHFSAALASHRELRLVRSLQVAALLNSGANRDARDEEAVRVVNAMRKEQSDLSPEETHEMFAMYQGRLIPGNAETQRFINAVPPAEHVATFQWLVEKGAPSASDNLLRQGDLCVLEEAAGQRDAARAGYDSIRRQLAGQRGSLLTAMEAGSKRLSR